MVDGRRLAALALLLSLLAAACTSAASESAENEDVGNEPAESADPEPTVNNECSIEETLALLRSGLPTNDVGQASSYGDLDKRSQVVVRGFIATAQRADENDASFTELSLGQVADIEGEPRADVDLLAYRSVWTDASSADPLGEAVELTGVHVLAFVQPWSGLRGDWNPGPEGLYVSCDLTAPMHAVIEDARGANDPVNPPMDQLIAVVLAERAAREAAMGQAPGSEYTPEELRELRESAIAEDPRRSQSIQAALMSFANGDDATFDNLPLARDVALGLGADIDMTVQREALRDRAAWSIDRPEGYAQFVGPFSALIPLADGQETQLVVGDHPHCAGDPLPRPAGFEYHALISVQPPEGAIDSCIQWFAIDLFLNPRTLAIDAIVLNLFGA